jgi:hypothetical protein
LVVTETQAVGALGVLACPARVRAALKAGGHVDERSRLLTGAVTTVLVLGLCLFSGEGCSSVLSRLWPMLGVFNPSIWLWAVASAPALSGARARLPVAVMRALFEASTASARTQVVDRLVFGLVVTAVDGTVFDLAPSDDNRDRYATPSGGQAPQARAVTLVECATRWVTAAEIDSSSVSEQVLWDRLAPRMTVGTLNTADRNFFSMHRWRTGAATGAHLIWRVKNGVKSLPAKVTASLPDGSHLVTLRESDAMLTARRKRTGQKKAPRLEAITARLVEFIVIVTDESGRKRPSRFRVLTTLLDPHTYPAIEVAACYAHRWQVELVYKSIKSTLRGPGRRLRGQTPDLAEQEIWGFLTVYNTLIAQATATAVDLEIDPHEISFTVVLRAIRDHLTRTKAPCTNCGHQDQPDPNKLNTAIAAGPRNRPQRKRAAPRTPTDRQTQHTRKVTYTITIEPTNLPKQDIPA